MLSNMLRAQASEGGIVTEKRKMRSHKLVTKMLGALAAALCIAVGEASAGLFTIDLVNNPVGYDGLVVYQETAFQTSGTGVIDPFLGLNSNDSVVWGYDNDEGSPESPHVDTSKTHSLTLDDVPVVALGGTPYREFLLDCNQESGGIAKSLVQLTQLEIYTVDNNPNINILEDALPATDDLRSVGALAYSLDDVADNGTVDIDADPPGSGKADMFLYVPDSYFTVFNANESTTNVYLYCEFMSNNDGFEEWAVLLDGRRNPNPPDPPGGGGGPIPEPSAAALFALGALGSVFSRKRRV
ncbi:MAG: PEP-CTERM sorting domain-containing protein [Planctomycetota bacterium]